MNLLLIRHADALPLADGGTNADEDRPLSALGHSQCAPLARALERLGIRPEVIVTSPLLRARQTASDMLEHWNGKPPELRVAEELAPGHKRRKLAKLLAGLTADTVALVGHMPDLGSLGGWLIGDKTAQIRLTKAGAAYFRSDMVPSRGSAALTWMVTPEWCQAVGG
jgi:phosphohistidine phosphatase